MASAQSAVPGDGTKPVSKRRNREKDVHRAAIRIFCAKGYSAASIQDVANEVGVLKGSLYHYISSKDDLLTRIFDDAHEQASALLEEVAALEVTPLERLRYYFEHHVTWYLENVEHATVFFREWSFLTGDRREVVARRRRSYERYIAGMIEDCQRVGDIDPQLNVKYALFFVLGAVNAVPEWYRKTGRDEPARIASIYADLTIGALTGFHSSGGPKPRRVDS